MTTPTEMTQVEVPAQLTELPGPALARLASMPRVDLMPPEIGERRALRHLQGGLALAVAASVALTGGLFAVAHGSVTSAKHSLADAETEQAGVQTQVSALSHVAAVYAQVAAAKGLVSEALAGEVRWSHYLTDLSLTIPNNVWVTSMTVAPTVAAGTAGVPGLSTPGVGTVTFQGVALNRNDVAAWLESLAHEKGYADPYFTTSAETLLGSRVVVNFTSNVTVSLDALSKRYTATSGS